MKKTVNLSKEDILHLAQLANLKLSEKEVITFQKQLTETLDYVENLNELNIKDITPTNYSTDIKNCTFDDGTVCERMFSQEEALENTNEKKNSYFVVKRIM